MPLLGSWFTGGFHLFSFLFSSLFLVLPIKLKMLKLKKEIV